MVRSGQFPHPILYLSQSKKWAQWPVINQQSCAVNRVGYSLDKRSNDLKSKKPGNRLCAWTKLGSFMKNRRGSEVPGKQKSS